MQRFYNYQYMYLSIKIHVVESDDFYVEIKKITMLCVTYLVAASPVLWTLFSHSSPLDYDESFWDMWGTWLSR